MQVSFQSTDGQEVKFMINDKTDEPLLDYYVANQIQLSGLKSLVEKDGTIEIASANVSKEEEMMESVTLTPKSAKDVKRVLALARKIGLDKDEQAKVRFFYLMNTEFRKRKKEHRFPFHLAVNSPRPTTHGCVHPAPDL